MTIAVLYLARFAEGYQAFRRFADSYRAHPAEQPHDLIIIAKGFERPGQFAALAAVFAGIPHRVVEMPDDIGMDIHAYRRAALLVRHDVICCLNTFSLIRSDGWLRKLYDNLNTPGIGMVGATGSFESLLSSWKVMHRISWYCSTQAAMDKRLVRDFAWLFALWSPISVAALNSRRLMLRRKIGDLIRRRPKIEMLTHLYPDAWTSTQHTGGGLAFVRDYPTFPNPHIRSNAFMLRRADFLAYPFVDTRDKLCCMRFESGADSMTNFQRQRGLLTRIVGDDGKGYDLAEWPHSNCFRSGNQENLLIIDNQTDVYQQMPAIQKERYREMTWGGYAPGTDPDLKLLDVPFPGRHNLDDVNIDIGRDPSRNRFFSIVIPCRNRNDLLLDAIKTIRGQDYQDWEICVFDNASDQPIGPALSGLNDQRIRCERSDVPLQVTASWNRAIDMAGGDYVTLIGDDDGLLPGFFTRLSSLADRFDEPEVIYSSLYQFIHPAVDPSKPEGYVRTMPSAAFLEGAPVPFVLDRSAAKAAVDSSLAVRRSFLFTMPSFTCRRDFLDRIRRDGKVLHSPFPDYYFANVVLEMSRKTVCEPKAIAFQGVSKASFGFALLNGSEDGFNALGEVLHDEVARKHRTHLLPGPRYQSEYIVTMAHVAEAIGAEDRKPDFDRYRHLQIFEQIKSSVRIWKSPIWTFLTSREKLWALQVASVRYIVLRFNALRTLYHNLEHEIGSHPFRPSQAMLAVGDYVTGPDVFNAAAKGDIPRL